MRRRKAGITRVTLRPAVTFSSARLPDAVRVEQLHPDAHEGCFIASSVTTQIEIRGSRSCA
jgi:organic hydroperoxide reductase OsmC/OhrA